jgi:hypothetical protein
LIVQECLRVCDYVAAQHKTHNAFTLDFNQKNILAQGETAADIIKSAVETKFDVMAAVGTIESIEWIEPMVTDQSIDALIADWCDQKTQHRGDNGEPYTQLTMTQERARAMIRAAIQSAPIEMTLGQTGSADRFFYEAGWNAAVGTIKSMVRIEP